MRKSLGCGDPGSAASAVQGHILPFNRQLLNYGMTWGVISERSLNKPKSFPRQCHTTSAGPAAAGRAPGFPPEEFSGRFRVGERFYIPTIFR